MKTSNHKLAWLLRREMWENKGGFLWAPLAIGLVMIAMMIVASLFAQGQSEGFVHLGKVDTSQMDKGLSLLAQIYPVFGAPILIVLALTVFFYSLNSLFDERKDRSIMFWKSLPISDGATVASKALIALVIAPLIAVVATLATSVICLIGICLAFLIQGVNLFGVFAQADTYLTLFKMLALVPVYAVSALPTVGWLMLVGAAARGKPFLWAILIPIGIALGGLIMGASLNVNMGWTTDVAGSMLFGTVPGSWLVDGIAEGSNAPMTILFDSSIASLAHPILLIGAVAGLGMLALAAYLRRRGEEI